MGKRRLIVPMPGARARAAGICILAGLVLAGLAGCTGWAGSATGTPAATETPSTSTGATSTTTRTEANGPTAMTTAGLPAPAPTIATPTAPVTPGTAAPTFVPSVGAPSGSAEVASQVQVFIDVAAVLTARGTTITRATVGDASPEAAALLAAGQARMTGDALVIYIEYTGTAQTVGDALATLGAHVESASSTQRLIQAAVPLTSLAKVSVLPSITRVRLPDFGVTNR